MPLTLSNRDIQAFLEAQQVLLAPLKYDGVDSWGMAVLRSVQNLVGADRSALLVPFEGSPRHVSETIEPEHLAAFRRRISDVEPGAYRFSDDGLERAFEVRRARGIEVWSVQDIPRLVGLEHDDLPTWHEAVIPAGIEHSRVMSVPMPAGETFLGVAYSDPEAERFPDEQGLLLLQLLVPSLKAGMNALIRLDASRDALGRVVDDISLPLGVYEPGGNVVHRSSALRSMLAVDPEADRLTAVMRSAAVDLLKVRQTRAPDVARRGYVETETKTARYRIRATYLDGGVVGFGAAALVQLERADPILPSEADLQERYGLTPRQADVALLLAQGLSNAEVAERLGISPHTARHHTEWVFSKLGVRSRSALAARLLTPPR